MKKINIAIDGYSSCGKSTLARQLAQHFNFIYIDSGAMYRAVALFALEEGFYVGNQLVKEKLISALDSIEVRFTSTTEGKSRVLLNNRDVEDEIRQMHVSSKVSEVAAIAEVRKKLVRLQQTMAAEKGVVMDGRDIGTHVIPNAEVKLFMTARPEVRAQRRLDELKTKGIDITYDEVFENLRQRDELDSNRDTNPLRQAEDAILFDNSEIGMQDQFQHVVEIIKQAAQ